MQVIKEKYFTRDCIDEKARELLSLRAELSYRKELQFDNKSSALLVLDMQDFFLSGQSHAHVPSSEAIVPIIKRLIEKFEDAASPIVFTRHLNTTENAGMMSLWWRDILNKENPLSEISSKFDYSKHEVIEKSQYDAFYNTRLNVYLKENEIKTVVICGVMTHLCCETTARAAFVHGYEVIFPVDTTATYNLEFHKSTLRNLSHGFAHLCTAGDLI
jgi:bifunctional isochorismate lyase/aryl carrier protein